MRKLITATIVVLLTSASLATAQNTIAPAPARPVDSGGTGASIVGNAPVGHRQPRVDQVPDEKNLSNPRTAISDEDAALDRKIKGICKGC